LERIGLRRWQSAQHRIVLGLACGLIASAGLCASKVEPPATPAEPVIDDYFGVRIADPYRWMETRDARFEGWLKEQDAYARAMLASIPGRDAILERLTSQAAGGETVRGVTSAGGRVFYLKRTSHDASPKLYVREDDGAERLLVDPNDGLSEKGASIDYFEPSPDGSKLAYGVSMHGSERSTLHVVDVATAKKSSEAIDRTDYADPSWTSDGKAFYYNRLEEPVAGEPVSNRYLHSSVYLHVVGENHESDRAIFGAASKSAPKLQPTDSPYVVATPASDHVLALIGHGADPALSVYVAKRTDVAEKADFAWKRVATAADGVTAAVAYGDWIYLLSSRDAPRFKVVATRAAEPDLEQARVVVPTSARVITGIAAAADALYVSDLDAGLGKLRRVDWRTQQVTEMELPFEGALRGPVTDPLHSGALVGLQNWIAPERWYRVQSSGAVDGIALLKTSRHDTSQLIVEELKVTSFDGAQVPLSIVRRRDVALNGSAPAWLTAYGAYGVALTPSHAGVWGAARLMPLLEDGGVYAVCHVRGGGEYGEEWRLAGKLERKPNSYKDLIACAEHLVSRGYTRSSALALEGASAGGIVAAMSMIARPELFRVVFNRVGDNNPLRLAHGADGPLLASEFGDPATPAGFKALHAIDPTQHVRRGVDYPAVMLTAAFNDARVAPWQPGKLAAHLQAANPNGSPVILRVDFDGGHVTDGPKADAEHADMLAFFYYQLGRTDYQPNADRSQKSE
jgi:prolyl oligopeptidase